MSRLWPPEENDGAKFLEVAISERSLLEHLDHCYRAALFMVEATVWSMDIGGCRRGANRLMSINDPALWSAGRDG
jgi:hypothetical protein